MPYITRDRRRAVLLPDLDANMDKYTAGDLNFMLSRMVDRFMLSHGGLSYTNVNTVVGVLECAKLELYRRVAAPYEDKKLAENGEVYGAALQLEPPA